MLRIAGVDPQRVVVAMHEMHGVGREALAAVLALEQRRGNGPHVVRIAGVDEDVVVVVVRNRLEVVHLAPGSAARSEEHTSELQSRFDLVCRLLLEKKKCKTQEELSALRDS